GTRLCAGRNHERFLAVWSRDRGGRAERGLGERHRQFEHQVVAFALEAIVGFDLDHDDEVAGNATARARRSLAAQGQVMLGRDARRYVNRNRTLALDASLTSAHLTRCRDDESFTVTRGTRSDLHELPEHRARGTPYFAGAAARRAGCRTRALSGASALAGVARNQRLETHIPAGAEGDLLQR